jgi:hypothetical protein
MKQNKLSFESENLLVDWIGFNIQGFFERKQVKQIAKYLFQNFGFNSTFALRSDGKEEILFYDSKNKYQVFFRVYQYSDIYWDGIKIDFSGPNGHQFYKLIVANQVNWKILNQFRLSRLDLCYSRKKTNDKTNLESFFKKCFQKVAKTKAIKHFSLQQNSLHWIFKVGKRGSPNYFRLYQNHTEIRFELEQRGFKIKLAQQLIFENKIEEFERLMVESFFKYTKRVLEIDENYTDWLIDYYRRQNQNNEGLVTGYFYQNQNNLVKPDDKKIFFRFLQFIAFSRTQTVSTKTFCGQSYCILNFKLNDFMDFIQIKNKNQYQRELLIQFFNQLQSMKPFVKIITDNSFQSFTIFPVVKANKQFGEYGTWTIQLAILQELYFYNYRFFLPTYFLTYQKYFELEIKLQFLQSYTTQSLHKTFYSQQILDQYKNNNNKKKAQIKRFIQHIFQQAFKDKIIQNNCQIEFKNKKNKKLIQVEVQKLNPLLIGQSQVLHFYFFYF